MSIYNLLSQYFHISCVLDKTNFYNTRQKVIFKNWNETEVVLRRGGGSTGAENPTTLPVQKTHPHEHRTPFLVLSPKP